FLSSPTVPLSFQMAAAPPQQPPSGGTTPAPVKKPPLNLANKPGEPAFQLKLEPSNEVVLTWTKGVSSHVDMKITNSTPDHQSYKVKCTDNNIFRVRPPLGFVEPGQTQIIKIFQSSMTLPETNRHFFALYHKKCTAEDSKKQPRLIWKSDTKPDGVIRLLAVFNSTESASAPVDNEKTEGSKMDAVREAKKEDKKEEKKEEKKEDKK
ncbi:hypothetical protein PMAYCL1PPCAC_12840, partial [Pristionchus mayeri]